MSRGFLRKSSVNTFIGIVWILFAVSASAQNAVSKFRADSIRQSLSCIQKPQDKIPLLKELIGLYWQLPEEVPALKEIIDIAMPLDSIGIVYDAMAGLSRYYYNVENRDSLLYWVGQLDSLASKRHESPRGLFLSGSLVCQDYLWSGNYELAMDKAMQYLDLARESKNDYGLLRAYRNLGMVYQRIKKDSDAVEISSGQLQEAVTIYEEIINKTETINMDAFDRQIEQLRVLNDLNDLEKQDRELKLKSEQEALKQKQIVVSIGLLLVLMGLLYMLWRIYMHTKRLRNELLQEKDSLIASEKQLRVVTKEAEAANKKKSAFIANISHEVRTPLNAIVGFSELLASSEYSEEEKIRFAGEVNHSSELLLNLVNDVLDLSRLESGKIKFSVKPNDLVACCQRALDSIRHRVKPGVRLTFTPSLESYTLNTDALRLQQLLTNLLSNAAKFTSEGEINLSFAVDESKGEVRFFITDTGCGIPEDKCKKIFERFEKLDDFVQGTGLGLSVCQIISEQLKGSLSVDVSYKGGARFVFIHPTNLIETPI